MPKPSASRHSHGRSEVKERPALKRAVAAEQKRLGKRLRALRNNLELSQETAAEKAGIHAKYLSRVEGGSANPSLAILVALAKSYGVSMSELFE